MISKEKLDSKLEKIKEHFGFRDFIGLSALIFGLLLSNSSIRKDSTEMVETKDAIKVEKTINQNIKKQKKTSLKKNKKVIRGKNKQRKTAAREK